MATPGLLLVDKPAGYTSHDVVAKLRKILGTRKIGHAGTLDPMATGLLVMGIESGTKLLTFIVGKDKTYEATIRLGCSTVTDDIEGEVLTKAKPEELKKLNEAAIRSEIAKLTGIISQIPSSVSAIKVDGVRSYDLVRAGEEVNLKARQVEITRFEVLGGIRFGEEHIELDVIVDCSSGTYIRALARDLGNALGVGGHLTALRRTRVGGFMTANAKQLEEIESAEESIISLFNAAEQIMPTIEFNSTEVQDIRNGKRVNKSISEITAAVSNKQLVAVIEPANSETVKSLVVFNEVTNG